MMITSVLIAALAVGAGEFTVEKPLDNLGPILYARDFGVDTGSDFNGAALNAAFTAARERGASALIVDAGVYRCFDDHGVFAIGLTNFTFEANGALFIFRRPSLVGTEANFNIRECDHAWFRNFRMDWDWENDPLATIGTVVARHVDERDNESYFDIKVDRVPPCYPDSVPLQTITTVDSERKHLIGTTPNRILCGLYEGHFGVRNEWVGEDVLRVWPNVHPGEGRRIIPGCEWAYNAGMNRWTVSDMKDGASYRMLHYYYGKGGIHLTSNVHLTVSDVEIWSCRGFGMGVDGKQKFWRVENFTLAPPADKVAERLTSSTADGHHVIRSFGYCQYEGCTISFCNDDSSNFHDCTSFGVTEGGDRLRQTFVNGPAYLGARVGDEIELREANYDETGWRGRIAEVIDGGRVFRMDRAVPAAPKYGVFLFFNRTFATSHILIKNCVCRDSHFRNLWQSGDLTIENCTFERMGDGQHFLADWTHDLWSEGMGVSNVVVRNCRFKDNNQQSRGNAYVPPQPELTSYLRWPDDVVCDRPEPGFFRDFLIEGNVFENPVGKVADFSFIDGLIMRNNLLIMNGIATPVPASMISLTDCLNVESDAK